MNNHMKLKITLLIIVFLLLVAAIVYIMAPSSGQKTDPYTPGFSVREENQPSSSNPATADPTPYSLNPNPSESSAPAGDPIPYFPTPTPYSPTPTPYIPTPTPFVPTPDPVGQPLGQGTIASTTPWLLNIHADWSAVTAAAGNAKVEVIVYADHYPISYNSFESLIIRLGDDSHRMYANEIHTDVNQLQHTELGRYTYTIPLAPGESKTLPLSAVWEFNGYYGDGYGHSVEIPSLRCEGTVTLTR